MTTNVLRLARWRGRRTRQRRANDGGPYERLTAIAHMKSRPRIFVRSRGGGSRRSGWQTASNQR